MLKLAATGVWVILVTAGATYTSVVFGGASLLESHPEQVDLGVEELKSEILSVPILRAGDVAGYLILQLSFGADRKLLAEQELDPMPFLMDAVLKVIFDKSDMDFTRLKGSDVEILTSAIAAAANARMEKNLVRHVLLQQLNFVRKDDIRTNWISNGRSTE